VFMSELENFSYFEERGISLPCEEFPYATPEELARDSREWGRYKTIDEALRGVQQIIEKDGFYPEYGIEIWCEHEVATSEKLGDKDVIIAALTAEVNRLKEELGHL